jgi:hypothetical protein
MKPPSVLPESYLRLISEADRKALGKAGMTKTEAEASATVKNERELQKLIVNYLRLHDIEPLWFRTDKRTTANVGWPDITFAVPHWDGQKWIGIPCAWEVKMPDSGKLSKEQVLMAEKLHGNGWRHKVIRSFEQATQELREIGVLDCKD